MTDPSPSPTAYQALGEALLEEILVQAGITQGQRGDSREVAVTLNFVVSADRADGSVVVHGERLGKAPLEIRLDVSPAAAERAG